MDFLDSLVDSAFDACSDLFICPSGLNESSCYLSLLLFVLLPLPSLLYPDKSYKSYPKYFFLAVIYILLVFGHF